MRLFAYNGVRHVLCCGFFWFFLVFCHFYPMLSVSLDYTFLISLSVFVNVYLCLSQARTWISDIACWCPFMFSNLRRGRVHFLYIGRIMDHNCLSFNSIIWSSLSCRYYMLPKILKLCWLFRSTRCQLRCLGVWREVVWFNLLWIVLCRIFIAFFWQLYCLSAYDIRASGICIFKLFLVLSINYAIPIYVLWWHTICAFPI